MFIFEAEGKSVSPWMEEEINIVADYEKAFDKLPPPPLSALPS
jgi:hypothetical protein